MTPDKVRELVQWHMCSYPLCTVENMTRVVLSVLDQVKTEARHAALTEAAEELPDAVGPRTVFRRDILALRDKEQP